jgi:hypothetical protein
MGNHLDVLPEYGVLLTGTLENPVIENHSGRTVIAYTVVIPEQDGSMSVHQILLTIHMPDGLPDGGLLRVYGNVLVNPAGPVQGPVQSSAREVSPGQPVTATLQNVVFADGQFVGVDEHGTFESFGKRLKAIVEIGLLGKAGAWGQIETIAPGPFRLPTAPPSDEGHFRQLAAARLVEARKFEDDAAASQLAEIFSSLPTLWM